MFITYIEQSIETNDGGGDGKDGSDHVDVGAMPEGIPLKSRGPSTHVEVKTDPTTDEEHNHIQDEQNHLICCYA